MSNFAGCESFLNSNSLDILALYEANVVEQFLCEVLSLIQKESAIDLLFPLLITALFLMLNFGLYII